MHTRARAVLLTAVHDRRWYVIESLASAPARSAAATHSRYPPGTAPRAAAGRCMGISRRNFRALNITFCLGSQIASYTQRHAPASPGAAHLRCCAPGWDATAPSELSASTPLRIAPSALMFSRKRCTIANNISVRASPQTEEQIRTPCLKSAVVHGPPAPTARSTAVNRPAASKRRPHLSPGRACTGRRRRSASSE